MAGSTPCTGLADAALQAIAGQQDADRLLHQLRVGIAPADSLQEALAAVVALDQPERLQAFLRRLQKAIEHLVA